eukprot:scaffold37723_cov189-Skeletonema_marinoi.AAC.13
MSSETLSHIFTSRYVLLERTDFQFSLVGVARASSTAAVRCRQQFLRSPCHSHQDKETEAEIICPQVVVSILRSNQLCILS